VGLIPRRQKPPPPPRPLSIGILLGALALTIGGYGPWAKTATKTVWGSNSGGAGVGTAGLLALVLAVVVVATGRRWPAAVILLVGAFSVAATGYYLVDTGTVASDAGLNGGADPEWGLWLAFFGAAVTTFGAAVLARLRKRRRD
jgi:hypothetical protein